MQRYLYLFIFLLIGQGVNAQMFDELKTKQKELDPAGIKFYLEGSIGLDDAGYNFYVYVPDYTSPLTNYYTKAHIEKQFASELGVPVTVSGLLKISDRFNLGVGLSFAPYNGSYIDFTAFNSNNVSLTMLTYYARAEYKVTNSLRNSFMVSAEAGSFLPIASTLSSVSPHFFAGFGLGYIFKISGHVQILAEIPFTYRSFHDLGSTSYPGSDFGAGLNIGVRFGI